MATADEYRAAADRADAAGKPEAAAKLRAFADSLAPKAARDPAPYLEAAKRADAAGAADKAAKLRAYAATLAPSTAPALDTGPVVTPPPEGSTTRVDWSRAPAGASDRDMPVGMDEAGNRTYRSPSGQIYTRPMVTSIPMPPKDWASITLGDVGDSLYNMGAGIVSSIGQGITAPGRALSGEPVTNADAWATASLAMPGNVMGVRGAAPLARAVPAETALAKEVAAATERGIPVMRTDVAPPKTFIGKVVQKTGESIPLAGTGGPRAAQNAARIKAAQDLVRDYAADVPESAIDDVTASVLEKRGIELKDAVAEKEFVIGKVSGAGAVPVPRAIAEIDRQIAALEAQNLAELKPVIAKLQDFRTGLQNQSFDVLEKNRKAVGSFFAASDLASIRDAGEKALSAIYGPLREDMGSFIAAQGGKGLRAQWEKANGKLSAMAGDLKNSALRRVLATGEATPEEVGKMLFSMKPSDVERLYKNLTPEGQARARTAIIQRAFGKSTMGGDIGTLSPDKFKQELGRMGPQISTFFKGDQLEAVVGLQKALRLTERAAVAGAAPLTGVQNVPAVIGTLVGTFTGTLGGTVTALGTIGMLARVYEATGVQRALRRMARAQTPEAQSVAAQGLNAALQEAAPRVGAVAATGAANNTGSPYDTLLQRYGGPQ